MSLLAVKGNCLAVSRVILRTLDEWKCFRCLEKVILWSRLAKDEFGYHRQYLYLILLSGRNDLRRYKLVGCDLLTLKICQVERTVLVSVRILVNKINTYRLKR